MLKVATEIAAMIVGGGGGGQVESLVVKVDAVLGVRWWWVCFGLGTVGIMKGRGGAGRRRGVIVEAVEVLVVGVVAVLVIVVVGVEVYVRAGIRVRVAVGFWGEGRRRGGEFGRRLRGMGFAVSRGKIKEGRRRLVSGGDFNVVEESVKRSADGFKGVEVVEVSLGDDVALPDGLVQKRTPIPAQSHHRQVVKLGVGAPH